jgi:hypothetical protein
MIWLKLSIECIYHTARQHKLQRTVPAVAGKKSSLFQWLMAGGRTNDDDTHSNVSHPASTRMNCWHVKFAQRDLHWDGSPDVMLVPPTRLAV